MSVHNRYTGTLLCVTLCFAAYAGVPRLNAASAGSAMRPAELKRLAGTVGDRGKAGVLHRQALAEHRKKNYAAAEELWYRAAKADPSWARMYFNLACATALQGQTAVSLDYMEIALSLDRAVVLVWMKNDSDLAGIRGDDRYRRILARYEDAPAGNVAAVLRSKPYWVHAAKNANAWFVFGEKSFFLERNAAFEEMTPQGIFWGTYAVEGNSVKLTYDPSVPNNMFFDVSAWKVISFHGGAAPSFTIEAKRQNAPGKDRFVFFAGSKFGGTAGPGEATAVKIRRALAKCDAGRGCGDLGSIYR